VYQKPKLGTLDFTIRDEILTPCGVTIYREVVTFEYKSLHTKKTQAKAS